MGNTGTSGPILGIEAVGMGFAGAVGNAAFGLNVPIAASGVAEGITDQSRIVPEVPWLAVAGLAIEQFVPSEFAFSLQLMKHTVFVLFQVDPLAHTQDPCGYTQGMNLIVGSFLELLCSGVNIPQQWQLWQS
jgi:hypothetical protein